MNYMFPCSFHELHIFHVSIQKVWFMPWESRKCYWSIKYFFEGIDSITTLFAVQYSLLYQWISRVARVFKAELLKTSSCSNLLILYTCSLSLFSVQIISLALFAQLSQPSENLDYSSKLSPLLLCLSNLQLWRGTNCSLKSDVFIPIYTVLLPSLSRPTKSKIFIQLKSLASKHKNIRATLKKKNKPTKQKKKNK